MAARILQAVEWVERSDTHQSSTAVTMGITAARLNPSYEAVALAVIMRVRFY